jgi:hypothetical protein
LNGQHKLVVDPDRDKTTEKFLEDLAESWGRRVERWKPHTAWDAANHRELRYYKKVRRRWEKALERFQQEEKRKNKRRHIIQRSVR